MEGHNERGKAGGHELPLFPHPGHIVAFFSSSINMPFKKVVLPGRVKSGGTEGEIVVAHGYQKRKKLICGSKGEIHGLRK